MRGKITVALGGIDDGMLGRGFWVRLLRGVAAESLASYVDDEESDSSVFCAFEVLHVGCMALRLWLLEGLDYCCV